MSGRILLIVVPSDAERSAFNSSLSLTAHRSIFALSHEEGSTRFVEVRPDLVILPMSGMVEEERVRTTITQMRSEPCGKDVPVVLYNPTSNAISDARSLLKKIGASAFIPWPPRLEVLVKAIGALTHELSTDSVMPIIQEEATAEITVNHADDLEIDPILAQAALALDQEVDEIPTNPGQALSESGLDDVDISISNTPAPSENGTFESPSEEARIHPERSGSSSHTKEILPVFRAPAAFEPTPVKQASVLVTADPPENQSSSDGSLSVPEFLREPELPSRGTGASVVSETARKRIEEIPRGGRDDSVSVSQESVPIAHASNASDAQAARKGLDESRLGKRLVRRINKTYDALNGLTYYELLGVDANCNARALRDAYFGLSLEFHPDRFFLMTSGALKEKIYAIFRRINEAYVVLSDERKRVTYDQGLGQPEPLKRAMPDARGLSSPVSSTENMSPGLKAATKSPQAEDFVRRAQQAYSDHDFDGARLYLTLASLCEPQSQSIQTAIDKVIEKRPALNSSLRWR